MEFTNTARALCAGLLAGLAGTASAIDVGFTYQGYLEDNGVAADGASDVPIAFRLHTSPTLDQPVGGLVTKSAGEIEFDGGLFSTDLGFDVGAFNGDQLWLEVIVDGTALSPRQKVTAAPYSLATRGIVVDGDGDVGIGVSDPLNPLHVDGRIRSTGAGAGLSVYNPDNQEASYFLGWQNGVPRLRIGGNGPGGNGGFDIQRIGDATLLRIDGDGRLGIKEKNPDLRLTIDQQGLGLNNPSSQTLAFHTNGAERMRLTSDGLFGIRTTSPATLFEVDAYDLALPTGASGAAAFRYATGLPFPGAVPNTDKATVDITRLGGTSGAEALDVYAEGARAATFVSDESVSPTVEVQNLQAATALKLLSFGGNGPIMDIEIPGPGTIGSDYIVMRNSGGNQARIDRNGRGYFNNGTQTGGADVAEWFAVEGSVSVYEPGDLLVISTESDRTVARSAEAYSTLVAGVHATKPGVLLTERHVDADHSDMVPMGVVGVIPTKVSAENGPIRRGDLLVASGTRGHAMLGTDRSRMLGAIVGKALEDFDGPGTGIIRVMVSPR